MFLETLTKFETNKKTKNLNEDKVELVQEQVVLVGSLSGLAQFENQLNNEALDTVTLHGRQRLPSGN